MVRVTAVCSPSRGFNGTAVQFQESELDTITVGNFAPFQTGQLDWVDATESGWRYIAPA